LAFGVLTVVGLTAFFESFAILEDPFTAFLALDGIDVREELEVLHFTQLINTRKLIFPTAASYPLGRRAALTTTTGMTSGTELQRFGIPPVQAHHLTSHTPQADTCHHDVHSSCQDIMEDLELGTPIDHPDVQSYRRITMFTESHSNDPLATSQSSTMGRGHQ
jgi:hypothetical protein